MLVRFEAKRTDRLAGDALMVADFATVFDAKCADADIAMFGDIRVAVATTAVADDDNVAVDVDDDENDDVCFNRVVV